MSASLAFEKKNKTASGGICVSSERDLVSSDASYLEKMEEFEVFIIAFFLFFFLSFTNLELKQVGCPLVAGCSTPHRPLA